MNNTKRERKKLEETYRKKLEENPTDFDVACKLIELYLESESKRNWEKAFQLLKKYTVEYDNEPGFHRIASYLYMKMEYLEKAEELAIRAAEKYAKLAENKSKAYLYLGYIYWYYGKLDNGIDCTKKALLLATQEGDIDIEMYCKSNIAYFYAQRGEEELSDEALQFANEAYKHQKSAANTDTLGYVTMKFARSKQDLEAAKERFEEARNMPGTRVDDIEEHLSEVEKRLRV